MRRARIALGAAAAAGVMLVAGCASPRPPPAVGYARLEALVPAHPAHGTLAALDEWAAAMRRAAGAPAPAMPPPPVREFVPKSEAEPQPPRTQATLERAKQVIEQQLQRRAQELERSAQEQLARRVREAAADADAQQAPRRGELQRQFEQERRQALAESRAQVFGLQVTADNLARQLRGGAPERAYVEQRLGQVRARLQAALQPRSQQLAALERRYQEDLAALRDAAAQRVAREVAVLREALARERTQQLASERERLTAPLGAAAAASGAALGEAAVEKPPARPLAPAGVTPGALGQDFGRTSAVARAEWSRWSRDMLRAADEIARRRQRLADFIRRDTRITAQALARAHNWRLRWVAPGAKRGPARDITARAEKWLRAQWSGREK